MTDKRKTLSQGASPGDDEAHNLDEEGSTPSPATTHTPPETGDGKGEGTSGTAPADSPPSPPPVSPDVAAAVLPRVRYTSSPGATAVLVLSGNGDLLYPDGPLAGQPAVSGSRQQASGEPAEGSWVPLD